MSAVLYLYTMGEMNCPAPCFGSGLCSTGRDRNCRYYVQSGLLLDVWPRSKLHALTERLPQIIACTCVQRAQQNALPAGKNPS